MLARFLFGTTFLIAMSVTANLQAQSYLGQHLDSQVIGAGLFQDEQDDALQSKLEDQFDLIEVRLRELEDDVAEKLGSSGDAEEDQSSITEDFEERIAQLEETIEKQQEEISDIDAEFPKLLYNNHGGPKLTFYGRIHYDYWTFPQFDETLFPLEGGDFQDRFEFRRVRFAVKGELDDNIGYQLQMEFAGSGAQIRDAFISIKNTPYFNTILIGNHKRPYGLDNLNSSNVNLFIERPFVTQLLNRNTRRIGISSNGYTEDLRYNWRYGLWNLTDTQSTGVFVGDHYQPELAGRIAATPWYDESSGGRGYAHFAIAGSVANADGGAFNNGVDFNSEPEARTEESFLDTGVIDGADATALLGLEAVVNVGAFRIEGEYLRSSVRREAGFGNNLEFDGGYVQVGYFLTGDYHKWNRQRGTLSGVTPLENFFAVRDCDCKVRRGLGAFQLITRYSWADATDEDIDGGEGRALTTGFNWWWNKNSRMQFNYGIGEIDRGIGNGDYQFIGMRWMTFF